MRAPQTNPDVDTGGLAAMGMTLKVPAMIAVRTARFVEEDEGPERVEWVDGDEIEYPAVPALGCLSAFVALSGTKSARFEEFTAKWGSLGIGRTGIPAGAGGLLDNRDREWETHRQGQDWAESLAGPAWRNEEVTDLYLAAHWEPLNAWRFYVGGFCGILNMGHALLDGGEIKASDWRAALALIWPRPEGGVLNPAMWDFRARLPGHQHAFALDAPGARKGLSGVVHGLFDQAGIVPRFYWSETGPGIRLSDGGPNGRERAPTLFASLVCQLASALISPHRINKCAECRTAFIVEGDGRAWRRDQEHRCPNCKLERRREANRISEKKRYAAKKQEAAIQDDRASSGPDDARRSHSKANRPARPTRLG